MLDKAGIQSEYTNIRSNNADLWFETHAKPIKMFLIVHLCGGHFVDETRFKVSNAWKNVVKKLLYTEVKRVYDRNWLTHVVHPHPNSVTRTS